MNFFSQPFKMVEPPPPPTSGYFTPKCDESIVPKPPRRRELIPRPKRSCPVKRPASAPLTRIDMRSESPIPGSGRHTAQDFRNAASPQPEALRSRQKSPPKLRKPFHIETKTNERRSQKLNWSPSGFDVISTAIWRTIDRLGVSSSNQTNKTLNDKWIMLSDLLSQYGATADADMYQDPLYRFLDCAVKKSENEIEPSHNMTCAGCVVLDQLLLLVKRTFPRLASLVLKTRSLVTKAIFVAGVDLNGDILPFDDVDDEFEINEQLERFNKKTFFQGVRELCAKAGNEPTSFESDEYIREKQNACVNRIIDYWQTEFKVLLLKAWKRYHVHTKELQIRDQRERELLQRIAGFEEELSERDRQISRLDDELAKLRDTSTIERKLRETIASKKLLQNDINYKTHALRDLETRNTQLSEAIETCQSVLSQVGAALRPDSFLEFEIQEDLESTFINSADTIDDIFLMRIVNQILERHPDITEGSQKMQSLSGGFRLLNIYLYVFHILDPMVLSTDDLSECLAADDFDKASSVLDYGRQFGIDLVITPRELLAFDSRNQHLAFTAQLVARICDPVSLSHNAVSIDCLQQSSLSTQNKTKFQLERQPTMSIALKRNMKFVVKKDKFDILSSMSLLMENTKKLQLTIKKSWQWNALGHTAVRISLNSTLEKMMGRGIREMNQIEGSTFNMYCDPQEIGHGVCSIGTDQQLIMLKQVLSDNYSLLRKIFLCDAKGDPPAATVASLWKLFETSEMDTINFTQEVFLDITRKHLQLNTTPVTAALLSPSEWVAAIIWSADTMLSKYPTLAIHEKVYWVLERHIMIYTSLADPTEFRESVRRTPVQDVIADYNVHLRAIFDHFTLKQNRMSMAGYTDMLWKAGVVATPLEEKKGQMEGKLEASVCSDIFVTIRDATGNVNTNINFACYIEVIAALSVYANSRHPYMPLKNSIRRFIESRLLRGLKEKVQRIPETLPTQIPVRRQYRLTTKHGLEIHDFCSESLASVGDETPEGNGKRISVFARASNTQVRSFSVFEPASSRSSQSHSPSLVDSMAGSVKMPPGATGASPRYRAYKNSRVANPMS